MSLSTTLFYRHPLDGPHGSPTIEGAGDVALTPLGPSPLEVLSAVRSLTPRKEAQVERRLELGRLGFVTWLEGKPAHSAWVQLEGVHPVESLARRLPVGADEAWIFDCYTAEWARGRRLYTWTLIELVRELARRGDRRVARIYTTLDNLASRRGIRSAGFTRDQAWTLRSLGPVRMRTRRRWDSIEPSRPETAPDRTARD